MIDIRARDRAICKALRETTISARALADRYGISRERVRQIAERDGVGRSGWQKARQARGAILARKRESVRERRKRRKERQNLEAAQLRALVQKDGLTVREAGRRLFPALTRSKAERLAKEFGIVSARVAARQRNAKIVRRLRNSSITLEALGAEYGLTRQRIQQIAKRAGITWKKSKGGYL
jgi:hypothetical protein